MSILRVGDLIEVEWADSASEESERGVSQWWKALVTEVKKMSARCRPVTVLQIQYGERGGYPETRQDVLICREGGEEALQCLITSEILNWRRLQRSEEDRSCFGGHENPSHPSNIPSRHMFLENYRENFERREERLRLRVSWLEGLVTGLRGTEESSHLRQSLPLHLHEYRLLLYLRESVSTLLNKPLAQVSNRGRFSELFGNQEILRVHADCSLAEFEEVSQKIRSDASIRAGFFAGTASRSRSDSGDGSERSITFASFSDVCSALGRVNMDTKVHWLFRTKTRRGARVPNVVRVLGVVLSPERNRNLPFCVFIGKNASTTEPLSQCREIPVLFRPNQLIDDVDHCFLAGLERKKLRYEEINRIIMDAEDHCPDGRRSFKDSKFYMSWTGVQRNIGQDIFRDEGFEGRILGRIQLELPAVLITGCENCKEVIDLCTADFLRESLK